MDSPLTVDDLAQEIRRVDGNHSLGAGALAEALMPFFSAYGDAKEEHARRVAMEDVAGLKKQVHDLNWALGEPGFEKMHDPQDQADHEEAVRGTDRFIQRMADAAERQAGLERKAARYDWLRAGSRERQGIPTAGHRTISRDRLRSMVEFNFWCTPDELDTAIDAAIRAAAPPQGEQALKR